MQGLDPPDLNAVGEGGYGWQVGAPQGTSSEKAVEGDSHRGGIGVLEGHPGWVLAGGESEGARGGGGHRTGGRGGRPRAALALCVSAICTGNCTGFLSFVLSFVVILPFPLFGGAV